jgi:CheY-like chemotaxis protein
MRALVVEDNPVNMLITVALLENWGLQVAQACDGRAALASVAEEAEAGRHFDVVLMDLQMPGLDGLGATRALRAAGVTTPVVALTATVPDDARAQAQQAGFADVLCKPIDAALMKAALARIQPA